MDDYVPLGVCLHQFCLVVAFEGEEQSEEELELSQKSEGRKGRRALWLVVFMLYEYLRDGWLLHIIINPQSLNTFICQSLRMYLYT